MQMRGSRGHVEFKTSAFSSAIVSQSFPKVSHTVSGCSSIYETGAYYLFGSIRLDA